MIPKLIVFAYLEEAQPFIDYYSCVHLFQLKNIQYLFSEKYNTYIIITGGGFFATSVAISVFFERYNKLNTNIICLNIGIAGSYKLPLYQVFYASKVMNYHNHKCFYPDIFIQTNYAELMSIEFPATKEIMQIYPNYMFDMEAYAFVSAVRYFVSNHFIHCIKFISDHNGLISNMYEMSEAYKHSSQQILALINVIVEKTFTSSLSKQKEIFIDEKTITDITKCYHLTYSQQETLRKALKYYLYYHSKQELHTLLQKFLNIEIKYKHERNTVFDKLLNALYNV